MHISTATVLMPVYNAANYLSESIDSILSQTYTNFDFIIINDGSTDESEQIILSYNDERIIYIKNESNIGIIATLNKGLELIKSKYIIRMDADDLAFPQRIHDQVEYMENNPEVVLSGSGKINFITGNPSRDKIIKPIIDENTLYFKSIFNTCIPHPSAIFRNDIIQKFNIRYDESYLGAEDKAMWLDLAKYGKLGNIMEPLIKYRVHENQISFTKIEECRQSSVAKTLQVLKGYGITFDQREEKALGLLCYPQNCEDVKMLNDTQKLGYKLREEFKKMNTYDPSYLDDFFKMRIKRILVWSTPLGLSLIIFIYKSSQLKLREFGYTFYKKAFTKALK